METVTVDPEKRVILNGYERIRVSLDFKDENGDPIPSKTEQCHKETCDIRNIIKQYDKNGLLLHVNKAKEFYGDFTEVNEYQESLNKVIEAENLFLGLPSEVRKEFDM